MTTIDGAERWLGSPWHGLGGPKWGRNCNDMSESGAPARFGPFTVCLTQLWNQPLGTGRRSGRTAWLLEQEI